MTTENSTTTAPAATLTEAQLFSEFLQSEVVEYSTLGKELYRQGVEHLLSPFCDYIEMDFDIDRIERDPAFHLEMIENELLGALANVRLVRKAFVELQADRLIDEDSAVERFSVSEKKEAA